MKYIIGSQAPIENEYVFFSKLFPILVHSFRFFYLSLNHILQKISIHSWLDYKSVRAHLPLPDGWFLFILFYLVVFFFVLLSDTVLNFPFVIKS